MRTVWSACLLVRRILAGAKFGTRVLLLLFCFLCLRYLRSSAQVAITSSSQMDRDLLDVTVDRLHKLYQNRYTVVQVVRWRWTESQVRRDLSPVQTVTARQRCRNAREDAEAGSRASAGGIRGVPIVTKANTSIKGWRPRTDGKATCAPVANLWRRATHHRVDLGCGSHLDRHYKHARLAASDTNRSSAFGHRQRLRCAILPGGSSEALLRL